MFQVIAKNAAAVVAVGVLVIGSFGASAQAAQRAPEVPSVAVNYGDLNLDTPAGVSTLYSRLRAAARKACDVREARPLAEAVEAHSCYRQALGAAVENVKSPSLSALHRGDSTRDHVS